MERNVWNKLPQDMINIVLSYGDPDNTFKYSTVLNQLRYYKKEFEYNRNNGDRPNRRWYNATETDYYKYALRETFLKRNVDKAYGDLMDNNSRNRSSMMLNLTHNNTIINIDMSNYIHHNYNIDL
tara:strand:+ start:391 stop:765 length:375 start_codon:yes stop_codon:yes gene_type:complete